jgi:hypothetical protein
MGAAVEGEVMAAISVKLTRKSLFVGSFAPLRTEVDPNSGLTVDDFDFVVPSGLAGGVVSLARGATFDPYRPTLVLLAGHQPGKHLLQVVERSTATVVDEHKFRVTGTWRNGADDDR